MASKKKKDKQPEVPEYQMVPAMSAPSEAEAPEYKPMSLQDFENWTRKAYQLQFEYAPQTIEAQRQAQSALYENMVRLNLAASPQYAAKENQLLKAYNPQFRQQYNQQIANLGGLREDVGVLGDVAKRNLAAGYTLGGDLSREVEQSVRGAQTARGNWLGNAPTAQEAMGKGQAMIDLFNQRNAQYNQYLGQKQGVVGAQQNFLQGNNPIAMMGAVGQASQMGNQYFPAQSYVNSGLGAQGMGIAQQGQSDYNSTVMQGYSTYQNALQNFNQNQIGATTANNEALQAGYNASSEAWQYRQAVNQGLYSTPSAGGGGMSGMMGGIMGGIGTGVSTGIGIAAAGAGAGTAVAGGAAAAASAAAAALCWIAQKAIPGKWKEFRRFLCASAEPAFRTWYIFNGRRIANSMTEAEAERIAPLMLAVL